jgi:hypothetical protein
MPQASLNRNGQLVVTDPKTGITSDPIDPSSLPGYFGDFRCETTDTSVTSCDMRQMSMTEDGSFAYEFQPNANILEKTNTPSNSEDLSSEVRKVNSRRKSEGLAPIGRALQDTAATPKLTNPAMCIKEGDIIFFNVDVGNLNYPTYLKNSPLNTNNEFNSQPFTDLQNLILAGEDVQTFSYVFRQKGTYVFTNKASGTVMTITVVGAAEKCQGSEDGSAAVSMVTPEALNNFGVQAQDKGIQPDWVFISLSLLGLFSFLLIVLTLFIRAQMALVKGNKLFERNPDVRDTAIYYDKLATENNAQYKTYCCGMFKLKKKKVDVDSSDSSDAEKKKDYQLRYKDLEFLLGDFNRAQDTLNRQLTDREKALRRTVDEEGNLIENLPPEDELVNEVKSLLKFVKQNKKVLNDNLGTKHDDMLNDQILKHQDIDETEEIKQIKNPMTKQVAFALRSLVKRTQEKENQFNGKLTDKTKQMQQHAYEKENEQNDNLKSKLLEEYDAKLKGSHMSDAEREALLAELHAKLSHINDLAAEEQDHQNHNLAELLNRRKQKREKLQKVLDNLGQKKVEEDTRYQDKLVEIKQRELDDKKAVDHEIDEQRVQLKKDLVDTLNQKRLKTLSESEKRLEDFKRKQGKGNNPEGELVFADMLADYGNKVKKLDSDLAAEKDQQSSKLEQKLKERKQARLREIEEQRKQKEHVLNNETVATAGKLTTEIKQIESLLDPIKDEEDRMNIISTQGQKQETAIQTQKTIKIVLSEEAQQAEQELKKDDKKEINSLLHKIDAENEVKRREIEQQKDMIKRQIDNCKSDDERGRLMKQLEMFDANLQEQLAQQQDVQQAKLKAAIEARKAKRKGMMDKVSKEKEAKVINAFKQTANNNVKQIDDQQKVKDFANRVQAGFNKESVQATENYLDEKNQQEAIELMNKLFEERAKALRAFMLELLTQKQQDFDLLREEYEPQKEFLRQKRVKNLIGLDEFTAALERITVEETERHQDIEIHYADKEKAIKDELEMLKLQADAEQMKLLKDRQTKERVLMFSELMKTMDESDQMKNYLKKSVQEQDRELTQFKMLMDKEKSARAQEVKDEHEQKVKELEQRQDRLVNVEEMLKKDEAKHMERFRRQREEMLARKLADQQRELLKDMNQKDVDQMLERHKRDLSSMDEVLVEEQARQMEKMREQMKQRTAKRARENVVRQIKLAEIQKTKQHEKEQAKMYEKAGGDLATSVAIEKQKEQVTRLVDKAALMQRMCQKQCYSRKIYFKRHIANQQKLNAFLGRGILVDWASSKDGDANDVISNMSALSLNTDRLKADLEEKEEKVTYSVLLEHIGNAERHYEVVRKQ